MVSLICYLISSRSIARKSLGNSTGALDDLETLVKLDSSNAAATKELKMLRKELGYAVDSSVRKIKKLKRIPIVDVGHPEPVFTKSLPTKSIEASNGDISPQSLVTSSNKPTISAPMTSPETPQTKPFHEHTAPISALGDSAISTCHTATKNPIELSTKRPNNWYDLQRTLHEIQGKEVDSSDAVATYLSSIDPRDYVKVIGFNLNSDFLSLLVQSLLRASLSVTDLSSRLFQLSQLPRFKVAWLLADEAIRVLVKETDLCDRIASDSTVPTDVCARINEYYT